MKRTTSARLPRFLADRVAFLVVVGLLLVAVLLVSVSPSFRVGAIDASGTRRIDPQSLIADSGLVTGQSFLKGMGGSLSALVGFRYGRAESRLLSLYPYLRTVEVRFRYPGRVSIEAVERVEVAYLAAHDAIVVIDADRIAVRILQGAAPEGIPLVEGIDITKYRLGGTVEVDRPQALDDALLLLSAVLEADTDTRGDLKLLSVVRAVRPAADDLIYLTVRLPSTLADLQVREDDPRNAAADMTMLRYAVLQGKFDDVGSGILDLSGGQSRFVPDGK
jgi:hypothetical protein